MLDDAHWMDSASWSLTLRVARGMADVLLVVASRSSSTDSADEHLALLQVADDILRLGNLPSPDALELARDRLGVVALPGEVEELILQGSQGNPLYCEELAYALRDAGLLRFEGGIAGSHRGSTWRPSAFRTAWRGSSTTGSTGSPLRSRWP